MAKTKGKSSEHQRSRGYSNASYARQPGARPPQERVLIVCEGQKTEPIYFKALRNHLRLTTVEIEGVGMGHLKLIKYAQSRRKDDRGLDEVWCVFDVETQSEKSTFAAAVSMADDIGIKLAVSNPAFEYWFLLHYLETDQPFGSPDEVRQRLRQADCLPNYEKNIDIFKSLLPKLDVAIQRAEHLSGGRSQEERFPNSSTTVVELVKKLISMSQQSRR